MIHMIIVTLPPAVLCHTVLNIAIHRGLVLSACCLWSLNSAVSTCKPLHLLLWMLQAIVKLPFADVKRLAIAAQQPDANEQELRPADEVCLAPLV